MRFLFFLFALAVVQASVKFTLKKKSNHEFVQNLVARANNGARSTFSFSQGSEGKHY